MPMSVPRRPRLAAMTAAIVAAATVLATPPVAAQAAFPSRPVTLVLPFPPGGSTDIVARAIQPRLTERLGQTIVVDNRAGAAGTIATAHVAKSAPDGHTLFLSFDTHAINPIVYRNLPYDTFKDLAPVIQLVRFPLVMGAWSGIPAASLKDFVAYAKTQPGKLNYASTGLGSMNHLVAEHLKQIAGIDVAHIPYKGGGPAITAMIGGEVAFCFLSYGAQRGHFESGRLKPLAVTGNRRMAELPNTPTVQESGLPQLEAWSWIGIFAPAATPPAVIARLHADFSAALEDGESRKRLAAAGFEVVGGPPEALDRFVRAEHDRWARFVRESKIRFE